MAILTTKYQRWDGLETERQVGLGKQSLSHQVGLQVIIVSYSSIAILLAQLSRYTD